MTSDPLARFLNQRSSRLHRRDRLRPMRPGEAMDMAVGAYQQLGATILKYTVLPTLICFASVVFVTGYVLPGMGVTNNPNDVKAQAGEFLSILAIAMFVGVPLFLLGLSYISAFVTGTVSDFMVGAASDPAANAQKARHLIPKILGITLWEVFCALGFLIVSGLLFLISANLTQGESTAAAVTIIAVIAFIVGLIAFPVVVGRQILAVPIAFIEGLKPIQCAKRSIQLLKQSRSQPSGSGTVITLMFTCFMLVLFLWGGFAIGLNMLDTKVLVENVTAGHWIHDLVHQAAAYMPLFFTLWCVLPVWSATATILYYERRTRLEGLDIEALAQDVYRHAKTNRFEL